MNLLSFVQKLSRRPKRKSHTIRPRLFVEELESRQLLSVTLQAFDGTQVPKNGDGDYYPNQYTGEGGAGAVSINTSDAVSGNSLQLTLTAGYSYAQFNPYNYAGNPAYPSPRGFARDYAEDRANWQFNTFDRLEFWIKQPGTTEPHLTNGDFNTHFGTYVKRVTNPDLYSDETGGGHWYHLLNLPNTGDWTKVVLNMHPHHLRGTSGGIEHGNQPHPTGESQYNYFDALTRFYLQDVHTPSSYPAKYLYDEFSVYDEPYQENDDQIYSITGTYHESSNRLIVTWSRNKNENAVKHEVRYAFSNIHELGWSSAIPAPNGLITPPGWQGYNGMVYDTTALSLTGRSIVYIAIKPENSNVFSQIALPLGPAEPPPGPLPGTISGYVYVDKDGNGTRGSTEAGIPGVAVMLKGTVNGSAISPITVATNADGSYAFSNLQPGTYEIVEGATPVSYVQGSNSVGTINGTTVGQLGSVPDTMIEISLGGGQNGVNYNFAELIPATLSGYIYSDANANAVRNKGEPGISNITVTLTGTTDQGAITPITIATNRDGFYKFNQLRPGKYVVSEGAASGFLQGKNSVGTVNGTKVGQLGTSPDTIVEVVLATAQNGLNYNFGEYRPSILSGYVYVDRNKNGHRDSGEAGISGVQMTLTGIDDLGASVWITVTTNAQGFYQFTNLRPGRYTITESATPGYKQGKNHVGTVNGRKNGRLGPTADTISDIVLRPGQQGLNYDFGEFRK